MIPWHGPTIFGQELGTVGSISLIERKFGNPGTLELVAGVGTNIDFLWRDSGPESARNGPTSIAAKGISPVLIQSRFRAMGKFEILAIEPSFTPDGGIVHYWRNDDNSSLQSSEPTVFGRDPARQTPIESLTFIQSNLANPGNLEEIVYIGDQFMFFWRDFRPRRPGGLDLLSVTRALRTSEPLRPLSLPCRAINHAVSVSGEGDLGERRTKTKER